MDVGASFTGVSSFSPIPVTALTFLNTYGAQAAAMLFCMATASSSENGGAATALLVRFFILLLRHFVLFLLKNVGKTQYVGRYILEGFDSKQPFKQAAAAVFIWSNNFQ